MENQHRKIKGYRELSEAEIKLMNAIKDKDAEVGELVRQLEEHNSQLLRDQPGALDGRWLAIGKTDLQKGFMALTRAVGNPDFF